MSRPIIAIPIGVLVGAALGFLLVLALAGLSPEESWSVWGWTSYPTLANTPRRFGNWEEKQRVTPNVWQYLKDDAQARFQLFLGLLVGGGFGALTGAAVSIRNTIVCAVRETRAPAPTKEPSK